MVYENASRSIDIQARNRGTKWTAAIEPYGVHTISHRVAEDGVVHASKPATRLHEGLYYFEATVTQTEGIRLGVGILQLGPGTDEDVTPVVKHRKAWWDDGYLESFESSPGASNAMGAMESYTVGDVIGCGVLPSQRVVFLTKNGSWMGDYSLASGCDTRLALFVHVPPHGESQSQPSFTLDITFARGNSPIRATTFLSRILNASTRRLLGHAPFPPEVLSLIVQHLSDGTPESRSRCLATLTLVCRHWSTILRPQLFESLKIHRTHVLKKLAEAMRSYAHTRTYAGKFVRSISIRCPHKLKEHEDRMPILENILSTGLLAGLTRLQQLKTETPSPENESPAPPRVALALPALLRPLANLSAVHLKSRSLHSCAQLLALIDVLPSLQDLTLEGVRIPRSGLLRAERLAASRAKLRTFSWTGLHDRPSVSPLTVFVVRLCTADDGAATFFDKLCCTLRAVDRHSVNPWDQGTTWGELTCLYKNGGAQADVEYSVCIEQRSERTNFRCSVIMSHPPPPPVNASVPQTSLLAVLTGAQHPFPVRYEIDVPSVLQELDTYVTRGHPFTLRLEGEDLDDQVFDIQNRLPELMPRAHTAGLVTVV